MLTKLEPVQELHHPWKVQTQDDHVNWEQHQEICTLANIKVENVVHQIKCRT